MCHRHGCFGGLRTKAYSGGGSTSSGGPPYKKPASTKQRAGSSEQAASEQAASEQAAPSSEQEREASSEKRPGIACEQEAASRQQRQRETEWWSPRSEWLLPTREQELANRLGIDSCFKCKGKDWELVKSCDDCGELICADCDNNYGGIGIPTWCGMGRCLGTLTLPRKLSEAAYISFALC